MDYDGLKALITSYLHRSDLASLTPDVYPVFIEHGRLRFSEQLRVPEMETYATVTLTAGIGSLSSDVVAVRTVLGPNRPLLLADPETVSRATTESVYAITGLDLWAPGCATATVYYWERPQTLVGAAGSATRTILSLYPHVWLYAALVEAMVYTNDPAGEATYQTRLDEEVRRANTRSRDARFPRPMVSDQYVNITAGGAGN